MRSKAQLLVGREDDEVVLSGERRLGIEAVSAFSTASARSDTPSFGRAVQMARKTFHLWTTLSGARAEAAICVAKWASVSVRRPKGVVG